MAKQDWFLKVIIGWLGIKGLLLFLLSAGLVSLINKDLDFLLRELAQDLNLDVDNYYINLLLNKLGMAKNTLLVKISIGLALYGILCLIQAYGLHKRKRWAEYLTVVAIGLLIPFEIYEVVHRLTVLRVAVLVLNIVIVYYLMKHKEFFPRRTQLPKLTP